MGESGVPKRTHAEILRIEELAEIARAAAECGVTKIRLTGGEPLVRRGIVELCAELRKIPTLRELTMTTNGSLLPQLAEPLRKAGVDRLNVSLDTLDPARFAQITRRGTLSEVMEGLRAARDAGFHGTKLNTVLLGGVNEEEIPALAELTRRYPLSLRFIELMPMGPCAAWPPERFLSADAVLRALPELVPAGADGVSECYRLPGGQGTVGLIRPLTHCFCAQCNRVRVTADGMLKPCLHSCAEVPLRGLHGAALTQALRQGILAKPARHELTVRQPSQTPRTMNEIGG
jgi:cyclic pyranopterin phosphate synthase